MNWTMIAFIAITWLIAGLLAFLIDRKRKKLRYETPFPFIRALFSGYVGLIWIIGFVIFPPKEMKE